MALNCLTLGPISSCLRQLEGYIMKLVFAVAAISALSLASPGHASETTTYTYDSKGRLVKVQRSGGTNNGTATDYEHDKADNRKRVKTTGR